ncbi:MAG: hypothetical protein ACI4W2_06900, partial [Eubacterium sp.]
MENREGIRYCERSCGSAVKIVVILAAVIITMIFAAVLSGKVYADDTSSQQEKVIHVSYSQGQHGIQKALN